MASDAQECPKCWGEDGVEVPMAIYPSSRRTEQWTLDQNVVDGFYGKPV